MTTVLQKKICMLGGFSVGKTSLVKRYVQSVFSETYLTTVGVKIDKKTVDLSDRIVNLILWDLAGEDDINSLRMTNLRGAAGYVLVADGTRPSTLDVALSLHKRVEADFGPLPFVLLLNKSPQGAMGDQRHCRGGAATERLVGAAKQCANRRRRGGCLQGPRGARFELNDGSPTREPGRTSARADL